MNDKKPTFRQPTDNKRFHERSLGENPWQSANSRFSAPQRTEKKVNKNATFNKKIAQKSPHFAEESSRSLQNAPNEIQLRKAGQSGGAVQVMMKNRTTDNVREKKTGPLSPRAPEKIRKNRAEEMKVYGENACLSLFEQRPESIIRVWATVEMSHKIGAIFSYLAANKKVYHVVDNAELTLVSGTEHHGGICMLVKKTTPFTLSGYLSIPKKQDCLLLLDNVRNAHNVGGLVRTCAFYGVKGIVMDNVELFNSASAMRVAEGGMEYVRPLETAYIDTALQQLRQAGYQIIHVSNNKQADSLAKVRFENKIVFVLSETPTDTFVEADDTQVTLSTVNPLKHGLNVAVTAGILLAAWYAH